MNFGPLDLIELYKKGLFLMADSREDPRLLLIDPDVRGILPIEGFHIPKRLARTIKSNKYKIRANTSFREVIELCGHETKTRKETWINSGIIQLYDALHRINHAHSVEVWDDKYLIGGLYGVSLGGVFFGESMFSIKTDTSKIALVHLVAALKFAGFTLLDAQFHNNHLAQFGLFELSRAEFLEKLEVAINKDCIFPTSFFTNEQDGNEGKLLPNLSNGQSCLELLKNT